MTPEGTQMEGAQGGYTGDPYAKYGAEEPVDEEAGPEIDMDNVEEAIGFAKANPREVANKRLITLAAELGIVNKVCPLPIFD